LNAGLCTILRSTSIAARLGVGCLVSIVAWAQEVALVLTPVTVIDGTGAPPRSDMAVVIQGGRIVRVGPAGELKPPSNARVVTRLS
jgi:hypothetical protein